MPWRPLPRIIFAVAIHPFAASSPADLPLELGDELYLFEQGGNGGDWYRGYLLAPPSLLSGLTSVKGQTLEARVFSGIFPRNCVEQREYLDESTSEEKTTSAEYANTWSKDSSRDSLQHKQSIQRHGSKRGSVRSRRSVATVEGAQDSGIGSVTGSSPTHRLPSTMEAREITRQLSHRSIQSSKSQDSPLGLPLIAGHGGRKFKRPPAPVPMLRIGDEDPTSISEPLVDEIASCLREWHSTNLHELLLSRRYDVLNKLSDLARRLDLSRRQLLHGVLTAKELHVVRDRIVWDLVEGNKLLSGEVVVRDPKRGGRLLTSDDSPTEMADLQSRMSLLERSPVSPLEPLDLYHLLVELKDFPDTDLISPTVSISLYSQILKNRPIPLTECFTIDLAPRESFQQGTVSGKYKTLFSNLSQTDIGQTLGSENYIFLIVRVQANILVEQVHQDTSQKESVGETNAAPLTSRETPTASTTPFKRGRQSLMWAQKQLGNTRRRGFPEIKGSLAAPQTASSMSIKDRSRPNTPQLHQPSAQQGPQYAQRTFAIGVLDVRSLVARQHSEEQRLLLWTPTTPGSRAQETPDDLRQLLCELMASPTGHFMRPKAFDHVRLGLQSFVDSDAEDLIARTPTLLQNAVLTPKISFSGAPTQTRSDIYLMLSEAYLPAEGLLSHPDRGTVALPLKQDLKNVQLTLEVRKNNGGKVERCIYPSSNSQALTAWRTTATVNGEPWNQLIRLRVSREDVPEAHLIMSIANAPDFPFALCWIPLWEHDAFIKDGHHTPLLYSYDKVTSGSVEGRGAYLDYPWKAKDDTFKDETLTGPVATLKLHIYLCSTVFSQDKTLMGLIRWRDSPDNQILNVLRQFTFVPEMDIVKMVDDVFDAIFGILVTNAGKDEYEDLVFNALVTTLGFVHDRRFNLGPLVDKYTELKFDYPFATPCLIRGYLRLLARPADPKKSRQLRATFKVGREILRFITAARQKQKDKEFAIGVSNELSFRRDFRNIFTAFESLMKDPAPTLVGSKTLIVQHLHTWLPNGTDSFSEDEVYQIASSFIDSCSNVEGKLLLYKLLLILNLSKTNIFAEERIQKQFSSSTEKWLSSSWGQNEAPSSQWRDQIRICCSIVSAQFNEFKLDTSRYFPWIIQSYKSLLIISPDAKRKEKLEMLFPTSYPFPSRPISTACEFHEPLIELTALLSRCSGASLTWTLEGQSNSLEDLLSSSLDVVSSILGGTGFPAQWLSLYIYHHRSVLRLLNAFHQSMKSNFLPSPDDADDFRTALWSKYFLTLLRLVGSKNLALERFPEQKRRAIWRVAGDVREQGANLLKDSWETIGWESSPDDQSRYGVQRLGGFQVQYVPSLVAPIVSLCLSVHEGLRGVAVRILQTMIVSEWTLSEDLSAIEAEMIECLDHAFKADSIGDSITQKLFVNELLDLFEPLVRVPGDGLWKAIKILISTVDELLDLLAAVHSTEINEAVRILHTLKLMDFLKDMRKENIFIRYVHQLADVQARLHNYTEAGLAIRLHADLYNWSSSAVAPLTVPPFPEQTHFERKERLYFEMIKYFEEGAAWDCALASYKELAQQYEFFHYEFAKLARTQHSMARIYESIAQDGGQIARYFRVTYRGLGFPDNLRDKDFIFEGGTAESQSSFADRLRLQHPAAQVTPSGEIQDLEGQYLQVSSVSPYRDLEHPLYQLSRVPHSIREHVLSSQPNRFAVTSKRHSPSTGIRGQWIEKTVYTTADTFPTIISRSEVISVDTVEFSPLQTAVERTSRKTADLGALHNRISDGDESALVGLTEIIKASVDPTSVSSVAQYRQLLPAMIPPVEDNASSAEEYEPVLSPMQNALKQGLIDHASTLKACLNLYSHPPHINIQTALTQFLHSTFAPELAFLAPQTVPSPPPTSYLPNSPSLPPSRGFSSDLPISPHLVNGITALPQAVAAESEPQPNPQTRSRLSLAFLKPPQKANGTDPAQSASTPDEDSVSTMSRRSGNATQPSFDGFANSIQRPSLARMKSQSSTGDDNERPMTAQSGRSGRVKKRLSLLGIGKGSVKSRTIGRGGVDVLEEE